MPWWLLLIGGYLLLQKASAAQPGAVNVFSQPVALLEQAVQAWKFDPRGNPYDAQFNALESQYNLPVGMLRRVIWQESRFNPSAVSPAGAQGIAQFMPATAAAMGFNPLDPVASINHAAAYLADLYATTGSWINALAAYNWGVGNVLTKGVAAAPTETQQYVTSITSDLGIA